MWPEFLNFKLWKIFIKNAKRYFLLSNQNNSLWLHWAFWGCSKSLKAAWRTIEEGSFGPKGFFSNINPAKIIIYSTENCFNFPSNNWIQSKNIFFFSNFKTLDIILIKVASFKLAAVAGTEQRTSPLVQSAHVPTKLCVQDKITPSGGLGYLLGLLLLLPGCVLLSAPSASAWFKIFWRKNFSMKILLLLILATTHWPAAFERLEERIGDATRLTAQTVGL